MKRTLLFLLLAALLWGTCTAFAAVTLPSGLTAIDDSAFDGDASLTGVVTLPSSVQTVGSRAFAGTSLHGLILPAGVASVDGSVLAGTQAAYLYLQGADTAVSSSLSDVAFVFGPADSSAVSLAYFYASDTLREANGFYYSLTEDAAIPLCAVDGSAVSGEVTVPKLVDGLPVRSLDTLLLNNCGALEGLRVPAYLSVPSHLSASTYLSMTAAAPTPSAQSGSVGDVITWTADVSGAYGDTTYTWVFDTDGSTETMITYAPSVSYTLKSAGSCTVSLQVTDEVGDMASATAEAISVNEAEPVYRALLVGNTYPGTIFELQGPANDVAGMRTMLGRMGTTDYLITTRSNLSSSGIVSAISSTFGNAAANDVSLFYFSGHGTNSTDTSYHGALMGTGPSYLTVSALKTALDQIPGKKIVILDSCHSGQVIGKSTEASGVTAADLNEFNRKVVSAFSAQSKSSDNLANSSYYVITAAHSTEESISMGYDADGDGTVDKYLGLFTYGLCYGSGWNMAENAATSLAADANGDGAITLYEAYAYARYKAQQSNPYQTAQIYPANSSMVIWEK